MLEKFIEYSDYCNAAIGKVLCDSMPSLRNLDKAHHRILVLLILSMSLCKNVNGRSSDRLNENEK